MNKETESDAQECTFIIRYLWLHFYDYIIDVKVEK